MKAKYREANLVELLEYIELDPRAFSRQDSLAKMEAMGSGRLPLRNTEEREFYLAVAEEKGFIRRGAGASEFFPDDADPRFGWSIGLEITLAGREYLARKRDGQIHKVWWRQVIDNVPTIFVSVATALIVGWVLQLWGPNDDQSEIGSGSHREVSSPTAPE